MEMGLYVCLVEFSLPHLLFNFGSYLINLAFLTEILKNGKKLAENSSFYLKLLLVYKKNQYFLESYSDE